MTPPRTEDAKSNLREGIKKMSQTMTPAAQVRRNFRLGRPPKAAEAAPLHRTVVWQKAMAALDNLRARMAAAGLKPEHVKAYLVSIELADPDRPVPLLLESVTLTPEEVRAVAFEQLGRDDVIALGMVFTQIDEQAGQEAVFPFQFMGLNERGITVLRKAAEMLQKDGQLETLKKIN